LASVFIDAYKEDFLRMIKGNSMFIDDTITEDIYINYVINYVVDVLFEYTNHNTNTINLGKYFKHVYMHNVDIWGIMSIYYELIKKPIDNYVLSSKEHKIYIQMLMNLLVKNIFENGAKVINIGKLVHDIKKVNLFLSKLRQYEEYKKNMNKITPYEDIVSENIHENVGDKYLPHVKPHPHPQPQPQPQPQPLVNNMKVNDSIAVRKLQLHRSVKRANLNPRVHQSMIPISNNLYRSQNRHNRTQRINVIKI
jgi:hypothetical protein